MDVVPLEVAGEDATDGAADGIGEAPKRNCDAINANAASPAATTSHLRCVSVIVSA